MPEPELHPETFKELVNLIQLGLMDTAVKAWDQIMEDRFLEGASWDQEAEREPIAYLDRD